MSARLLVICLFAPALALASARTPDALDSLLRVPGLEHALVSLSVKRVSDGSIILEHNPRTSARPASLLKLLPTFLALEKAGEQFTYRTTVSHTGTIRDGQLLGQLLIASSGDPTLSSSYFPDAAFLPRIVEAVHRAGISRITSLPTVEATGSSPRVPGSWPWEDVSNYYAALRHPFNYRDNAYVLTLEAGAPGSPARVLSVDPSTIELTFDNRVTTDSSASNDVWLFGGPFADRVVVEGKLSGAPARYPVKGVIRDPARAFSLELAALLTASGVAIDARPLPAPLPSAGRSVLLEVNSPPLLEIASQTNKRSINLFAEALGVLVDSADFGRAALARLDSAGVDTSGVIIVDACGLSPSNAAPAAFFTDFLVWAYPRATSFLETLPEAAVDASLAAYSHPMLDHRLLAKTGSMRRVRALAGYLFSPRHGLLAFSILVNNYACPPRQVQQAIRDLLVDLCNAGASPSSPCNTLLP
jgi:D-alanyl-D-alanine carboxypeptidase/D-alanyl-D-alanine-endopeptidase (penicillin-binding protein 4)